MSTASQIAWMEGAIHEAIRIARDYGQVDGAHHKMWAIDQIVRALMTEEQYEQFVKDYEAPDEYGDPMYGEWDEGIAP